MRLYKLERSAKHTIISYIVFIVLVASLWVCAIALKDASFIDIGSSLQYNAKPPASRLTVIGDIALDLDMIDAVERLSFPRAGMTENHEIVRVWYEDGRYFDIEEDSANAAYELMIYIALNAGI